MFARASKAVRVALAALVAVILAIAALGAQRITTDGLGAQLPAALGSLGGLKVECLTGCSGSGGGGGLTDTELRATPVPVSASSWPLPTGASTAARQDTGNTSLASLDTKTPALGQALAAASTPVVLTAAQLSTLTPPAAITGFATETTLGTRLTESDFDTKVGALTEVAPASDTASSGLNGRLQRLAQRVTSLIGVVATETTLGTRLSESDFDTKTGSLTEAAPASDTASSGLNGRLQRIAQRVSSLITALGSPFQAGGSIGNTSFGVSSVPADPFGVNADPASATGSISAKLRYLASTGINVLTLPALPTGANLIGYVGQKPTYAAKATITWTGTSLANGSAEQSTVVDWTSTRCADGRIRIQSKGQASGTNYIDWYVYTALGDTTYTDGATGSDAAFTAANRFNSRYLCSQKLNANTSATQTECQLSDVFATMPDKWGLIGINNTGAALSATAGDHVLEYECRN